MNAWALLLLALAAAPPPCPDVAARVDGHPIPTRDARLIAELQMRNAPGERHREDVYHDALNERIRQELLFRQAGRQGLVPPAGRVAAAEAEMRSLFPDEKAWLAFLTAQGFDPASYRDYLVVQETAAALMACELDTIPPVGDEEAIRLYQMHGNPTHSLDRPSPDVVENWRYQVRRKKRSMVGRELLDALTAKAKIERLFEPGSCVSTGG